MLLTEAFYMELKKLAYQKSERFLLAISGGVDSMVLLDLFKKISKKNRPVFGVAHINHKLRQISDIEEKKLKEQCEEDDIPFYSASWQVPSTFSKGVEAEAREFRYSFFQDIMRIENYHYLVTAHHGDDQAETILMKLTKGSQLRSLSGMTSKRSLETGELLRPFLNFSKDMLLDYAKTNRIVYFEDDSNQSNEYTRNRFRHHALPFFKEENPKFLKHIHTFSQQVKYANELIEEVVCLHYDEIFSSKDRDNLEINLLHLRRHPDYLQYFLLVEWVQRVLVSKKVEVSEELIQQTMHVLNSGEPNQMVYFPEDWRLEKSYDKAIFYKKRKLPLPIQDPISFQINEGKFLSQKEWLGIFMSSKEVNIPKITDGWEHFESPIYYPLQFPLIARHRLPGDRIRLKEHGYTKKISRIVIDQKIPKRVRDEIWLIEEKEKNIIWMSPNRNSYLSIPKETDKIHYRLIYRKDKG